MLKCQCQWYGRTSIKVITFFLSSQTCSHCGYQNKSGKNLSAPQGENDCVSPCETKP